MPNRLVPYLSRRLPDMSNDKFQFSENKRLPPDCLLGHSPCSLRSSAYNIHSNPDPVAAKAPMPARLRKFRDDCSSPKHLLPLDHIEADWLDCLKMNLELLVSRVATKIDRVKKVLGLALRRHHFQYPDIPPRFPLFL
jgi:hypothetical protein